MLAICAIPCSWRHIDVRFPMRPLHKEVEPTARARARAARLRSEATPPEELLWSRLRRRQLHGLRFRRQHPLGPFIADFYCHEAALVVEIDGSTHVGERKAADADRDRWMRERNLRIVRVTAHDVLTDIDAVMRTIAREAGA